MNRKLWMILGMVIVGAVVAGYSLLYPARHYQGDGTIHDSGVVSDPRFRVEFPTMALNELATRSFSFRKFPGNRATVFIQTPALPAPDAIERLVTSDRLVVNSSPEGVRGLWHRGCVDVSVASCDPCNLELSVANVDPATPSVSVVPTLQGGGVELP